jgi:hypothetical protein
VADAATEFEALARALKDAGEKGLQRELRKAIRDAAQPLARQVADVNHLKPYMPNRYAEVLAEDLTVTISQRLGTVPGVTLRAKGRRKSRHVSRLNQGILTHPVFGTEAQELAATAHGRGWTWVSQDIRPRYFDDPVAASGPEVRRQIEAALRRIIAKIYAH